MSAMEVEQSEDYTCIIAHGLNPKTTHIFGDCILEPCTVRGVPDGESRKTDELMEGTESYWLVKCSGDTHEEFIGFCFYCKKKLDGNDSCIYRGEKPFCNASCRDQEILAEEKEVNSTAVSSPSSAGGEKAFCSASCRDQEILAEEEEVNSTAVSSPSSAGSSSSFQDDSLLVFVSSYFSSSGILVPLVGHCGLEAACSSTNSPSSGLGPFRKVRLLAFSPVVLVLSLMAAASSFSSLFLWFRLSSNDDVFLL